MYQVNSDLFCPDLSNEIALWHLINQITKSMCVKSLWSLGYDKQMFLLSSMGLDCSSVCDLWNTCRKRQATTYKPKKTVAMAASHCQWYQLIVFYTKGSRGDNTDYSQKVMLERADYILLTFVIEWGCMIMKAGILILQPGMKIKAFP